MQMRLCLSRIPVHNSRLGRREIYLSSFFFFTFRIAKRKKKITTAEREYEIGIFETMMLEIILLEQVVVFVFVSLPSARRTITVE